MESSSYDSTAFLGSFAFPIMRIVSLEKNTISLLTRVDYNIVSTPLFQEMGCWECQWLVGETSLLILC